MKDLISPPPFFRTDMCRFIRVFSYMSFVGLVLFGLFMMLALFRISSYTFDSYDSYEHIPYHKVGLLLGTSSLTAPGLPNNYFTYRIMAASNLFFNGKISYILVSGDNRHESYNEPREMRRALLKAGVPDDRIVSDYAGISTLDSVVRASEVFMLKDMTIISQPFHNERALFIADKYGIDAVGFNAIEPLQGLASFKVNLREVFARIKCVFDVYFLHARPRFLGEPIKIGDTPMPVTPTNKPVRRTSKPKQLTDHAVELRKLEEYERLSRLAKQPTDTARYLKMQVESRLPPAEQPLREVTQQDSVLVDQQLQAQDEAEAVAAESLSEGNATYIDPDTPSQAEAAATESNTTPVEAAPAPPEQAQPEQVQPRRRARRQIPREDVVVHGDPWDYY